jgi:hypothetical protein
MYSQLRHIQENGDVCLPAGQIMLAGEHSPVPLWDRDGDYPPSIRRQTVFHIFAPRLSSKRCG